MPLSQKAKDRSTVIGLLAVDALFVFGAVSNYYRYIFLQIYIDIFLAVFCTFLTAIVTAFLIVLFASYVDKRKFLENLKEQAK